MASPKIFYGTIVNPSKSKDSVNIIENGYLITNGSKIVAVGYKETMNLDATLNTLNIDKTTKIIKLTATQLLIPGLIDTHIHAPQYPNAGLGYDVPLLEWLEKYTYKLECQYNDLDFSKQVYDAVVQKTLSFGTTTACYFASMFADSSLVLVDSAIKYGQRAFVGKINMTRMAPDNYIETPDDSIKNTETFIQNVFAKNSKIVQPIITPRFALSVDMDLMEKLGAMAKDYNVNIQTHIAENTSEVEMVKELYDGSSYAGVYDHAHLLTSKTVLAHGIYLTEEEMKLLAAKSTSISHCPNSNTRLCSGLCNVRLLQKNGINIGLGTDVSGGSSASIIDAMRCAVDTSTHLTHLTNAFKPINAYDAFCMATIGGAKALAIEDKVGTLEVGKEFDALIIDMDIENSSSDLIGAYEAIELLQKFVYLGDDRNVKSVYVAGKQVK